MVDSSEPLKAATPENIKTNIRFANMFESPRNDPTDNGFVISSGHTNETFLLPIFVMRPNHLPQ